MSALSVEVAGEKGIDISEHRSTFLNRRIVLDADLIVTMGQKHRETVGVIEPGALAYTHVITDFCEDADGEVPDPLGAGIDVYRGTFDVIERCLQIMADNLADFDGWKKDEDVE